MLNDNLFQDVEINLEPKSREPQFNDVVSKSHHPDKKQDSKGRIYFDSLQALHDFDLEEEASNFETNKESVRIETFRGLGSVETLWQHKEANLSLALLRQIANQESNNVMVLKILAQKLEAIHNFAESRIVRKNIVNLELNFSNLSAYADCLYNLNDDEAALEKYYEALSLITSDEESLFNVYKNMGNILVRRSDFDGAEEFYNKAYTVNSHSDSLLINIGTLHIQRQDFDKAVYCFRKAVDVNRKNDKAWVGLALVHSQVGDSELALANLEEAIQLNPENRTAIHIYCAWAEKNQRRLEAIEMLQHYLSTVDSDEEMSLVLINLFCQCGQFDLAKLECHRVLLWNPAAKEVKGLLKKLKTGGH